MKKRLLTSGLLSLMAIPALVQEPAQQASAAAPSQEYCITVMSGFPNDAHLPRYQFFKLTQEMAVDATPGFRSALKKFGEGEVEPDAPITDVIEAIANPVLRQAAPELAISYMDHLIDFAQKCEPYVAGQISSLKAFDSKLANDDIVIAEDALFLRQVLSDSLYRLDANTDPIHGADVTVYANALVRTRDRIEFTSYSSDVGDLEALYMTDLDGRLARSNDLINSEMNRETLGDAVTLSDDMNREAKQKADRDAIQTLLRILSRY